jgi:hypothetical protein
MRLPFGLDQRKSENEMPQRVKNHDRVPDRNLAAAQGSFPFPTIWSTDVSG